MYSGTYEEHGINIEIENITLQGMPFEYGNGSDEGKPFIDGTGNDIFEIRVKNVTIDGFMIENNGSGANSIISIYEDADNCIISNNDLAYTSMSFIWTDASYTAIINNTIQHSSMRQGIVLSEPGENNIVKGNVISDCVTGILTWGSGYDLIERNIVRNCERFGIDISNHFNDIQYNTFENNSVGLNLIGIESKIQKNNFLNNDHHATFHHSKLSWMYSNRWNGNYWGRPRVIPYPILGQFIIFPWYRIDWRPALVPN